MHKVTLSPFLIAVTKPPSMSDFAETFMVLDDLRHRPEFNPFWCWETTLATQLPLPAAGRVETEETPYQVATLSWRLPESTLGSSEWVAGVEGADATCTVARDRGGTGGVYPQPKGPAVNPRRHLPGSTYLVTRRCHEGVRPRPVLGSNRPGGSVLICGDPCQCGPSE